MTAAISSLDAIPVQSSLPIPAAFRSRSRSSSFRAVFAAKDAVCARVQEVEVDASDSEDIEERAATLIRIVAPTPLAALSPEGANLIPPAE